MWWKAGANSRVGIESFGSDKMRPIQLDRHTSDPVGTKVTDRLRTRPESFAVLALTSLYFAVFGGHNYSIDGLLIYRQALSIVQELLLAIRSAGSLEELPRPDEHFRHRSAALLSTRGDSADESRSGCLAWKAILVERASMAVPVGLGTKETAV